jgi:hypothetical protein
MTIVYRSGSLQTCIDLNIESSFTLAGDMGPVHFFRDNARVFARYQGRYGTRCKELREDWATVGGGLAAISREKEMEVA